CFKLFYRCIQVLLGVNRREAGDHHRSFQIVRRILHRSKICTPLRIGGFIKVNSLITSIYCRIKQGLQFTSISIPQAIKDDIGSTVRVKDEWRPCVEITQSTAVARLQARDLSARVCCGFDNNDRLFVNASESSASVADIGAIE